jgi:hypothetical protein
VPYRRLDGKTYHFNLIAKRPDNVWTPWNVRSNYPNSQEYAKLMECENMDIRYDVDATNAMIAKANEKGFLVMYNHPNWSCHSYPDYAPLKGLWGMELRNGECIMLGNNENNARIWKDLMNLGNRVFPVGSDDMHTPRAAGTAWIMVGAEKLEYNSVIQALEKGDFYTSTGPEIYSLTLEDKHLHITCSDARRISLEGGNRYGRCALPIHNDGLLREAVFDLSGWLDVHADQPDAWLRIVVHGPYGHYAATRGYTYEELK